MHHAVKKLTEHQRHWWESAELSNNRKEGSSESSERNLEYQTQNLKTNFQSSLNPSLMMTAVTQSEALNTKFTKRSFKAVKAAPEVSNKTGYTGEDREQQVSTQSSAEAPWSRPTESDPREEAPRSFSSPSPLPPINQKQRSDKKKKLLFLLQIKSEGRFLWGNITEQSSEPHKKQGQT